MESSHEKNAEIFMGLLRSEAACNTSAAAQRGKMCLRFDGAAGHGESAVSYHMRILCRSGIVTSRQEGKWTHYSISPAGSRQAAELLLELTSPVGQQGENCTCQK